MRDPHHPSVADASLRRTAPLPSSATSIYTDPLDLGAEGDVESLLASCELLIEAPAVSTAQLPDGQTLTYFLQCSDDAAFSSPVDVAPAILVQTGADSAGAAEAGARYRPPSTTKQFLRLGVTKSGAGDASAAVAAIQMLF